MKRMIAVDIGSTFTKGGLFRLEGGDLQLDGRASVPTTAADLGEGVVRVLESLSSAPAGTPPEALYRQYPVHLSSSARGGLRIAAVGLTPALTLQAARLAACSAGGRVIGAHAFSLTDEDVRALERDAPDIVLLAGGGYALYYMFVTLGKIGSG